MFITASINHPCHHSETGHALRAFGLAWNTNSGAVAMLGMHVVILITRLHRVQKIQTGGSISRSALHALGQNR